MSKNLTRKGYALGALVALASSLFAGSPALAADSVVLAANSTDKTLAAPADQTLTLNASLAPGSVAANISQLKYKVVNNGSLTVSADPSTGTTVTVASTDTNRTKYLTDVQGSATAANTLALSLSGASDTSTTQTVTVTAFIDSNSNSLFDDGEAFQTQTVSFLKYSEITSEVTWVAPTEGDAASISAKAKFTNINNEQLSLVTATVGLATNASPAAGTVAAWSATNLFKITSTYVPVKSTAVKIQLLINAIKVGTAVSQNVVAKAVDLLTADVVRSINAKATTAGNADVSKNKEFKVSVEGTLDGDAVSGVAVTVTLASSATLSATKTVTVNGTTYSTNATLEAASISATTDADGLAYVTASSVGLSANDTITFTAKASGITSTLVATQVAPTYAATSYLANSTSGTYQTVDGTAVAVNVVVKDQFGGLAPDATYDVSASFTSSSQTTAATSASATYAAVVGGKATLTVLDNGTGTGTNVYSVDLKTKDTNGVYSASANVATLTIKIVSAADNTIGKLVVKDNAGTPATLAATSATDTTLAITAGELGSSTNKQELSLKAFANFDGRNTEATNGASTESSAVTFNGVVQSATTSTYAGVAIANASVTVSGTGLQFNTTQNGGKAVYGDGTLTFLADANGEYSFSVRSHLAGKQTVTITSGTVTAKVYVNFKDAAAINATTVTAVVADGAAQFQAGRALDVTFKVTDKYGNPIVTAASGSLGSLTIKQTGAGYLTNTGVITTAADGTYGTKLITNAGDLGTSTITATLDLTTDVVRTVSSEFGVTDADVTVGGRAVYASVEFAKGKTVTVSVDGKRLYSKLQTSDAYTELKFTQKKAGKHTVTVRISGGIVYSEVVTTTK